MHDDDDVVQVDEGDKPGDAHSASDALVARNADGVRQDAKYFSTAPRDADDLQSD